MAQSNQKLTVQNDQTTPPSPALWRPFQDLQREMDRLFDDFGRSGWFQSLRPAAGLEGGWTAPVVDISETDAGYEITAELPGMDPRNVEVKLRNGNLVIRGEKREDKEEKARDYYVRERQFGRFERMFTLPEGVDPERIEARCHNGILTVTLPKSAEAKKPEKTVEIKAA